MPEAVPVSGRVRNLWTRKYVSESKQATVYVNLENICIL